MEPPSYRGPTSGNGPGARSGPSADRARSVPRHADLRTTQGHSPRRDDRQGLLKRIRAEADALRQKAEADAERTKAQAGMLRTEVHVAAAHRAADARQARARTRRTDQAVRERPRRGSAFQAECEDQGEITRVVFTTKGTASRTGPRAIRPHSYRPGGTPTAS